MFDKYVSLTLEKLRSGTLKTITPMSELGMVQTLCFILEELLTPKNVPGGCDKEWYEVYFVFAAVAAFGGPMLQDQIIDYRVEFSKWWTTEFKSVKFPYAGTVFDYTVDPTTKKFTPWAEQVPVYDHDMDAPLQTALVATPETVRIRYFMDLLVNARKPVLLVGNAGTGKTVLVHDLISKLGDDTLVTNIPFNHYTTSLMLQEVLEKPLEKKAGRTYGPPGTKKLIYVTESERARERENETK